LSSPRGEPIRVGYVLMSLLILAFFWGLAYLVMLNDIDFFTLHDLFDTTRMHHEHIVAALGLFGLIAAFIPLALGAMVDRERREWIASRGF
jgi:hypothetical protein